MNELNTAIPINMDKSQKHNVDTQEETHKTCRKIDSVLFHNIKFITRQRKAQ
jgi:hypothetical protein